MEKEKEVVKKMTTPITYYGGKQMMAKHILPLIPEHHLYSEAFFGGGAIFFAKPPSKVEFINDANGEIVNFYKVIKRNFKELKAEIDITLHSELQHREANAIYFKRKKDTNVMRAWAVWMLSQQSFYSIFGNTWKCGKNRNMANTIASKKAQFDETYVKRLEATSIFCRDALDVIVKSDRDDAFHYIDPPYFNADMGHYGGYTADDFEKLLIICSNLEGKFMLSSYPSELLSKYSKQFKWNTIELDLNRSAGGGRKVEVLTMNY